MPDKRRLILSDRKRLRTQSDYWSAWSCEDGGQGWVDYRAWDYDEYVTPAETDLPDDYIAMLEKLPDIYTEIARTPYGLSSIAIIRKSEKDGAFAGAPWDRIKTSPALYANLVLRATDFSWLGGVSEVDAALSAQFSDVERRLWARSNGTLSLPTLEATKHLHVNPLRSQRHWVKKSEDKRRYRAQKLRQLTYYEDLIEKLLDETVRDLIVKRSDGTSERRTYVETRSLVTDATRDLLRLEMEALRAFFTEYEKRIAATEETGVAHVLDGRTPAKGRTPAEQAANLVLYRVFRELQDVYSSPMEARSDALWVVWVFLGEILDPGFYEDEEATARAVAEKLRRSF